jgi:signal transduction histidine kinase
MPMRNPFKFFLELMQQPVWIPIWMFYLMVINMVSVGFWDEPLAKLIFITFMISAMLMMGLYSRFGFEKILGLGHIVWVPLLVYVLMQLPAVDASFKSYLVVLSVSIAISLAFDIIDVWKYFTNRKNT